jgi:pimeloyl-ACP methyl ester carboxylesterase
MLAGVSPIDLFGFLTLYLLALAIIIAGGVAALIRGLMRPPRKTIGVAVGRGLPTDPSEMGLAFDAAQLSLSDGSETSAWIVGGERDDGPVVLIVHGFGDSRLGALTWLPLLLPHASQVVLYDLRGHGESEARNAHCGTTDVADVHAILDQLRPERPVVLFGYSMGAGIAIAAAASASETVPIVGVIGDGAYRRWDDPIRTYFRRRRWPVWPIVPLAGAVLRLTVPGFGGFDRTAHARRLRCPLLLLHGSDDWLCPPDDAHAIATATASGELVLIEGGGHLDLPAVDPDRYADALTRFFGRTAVGVYSRKTVT